MNRDYSPIPVPKVLPPHPKLLTTVVLEPARALHCYEGADDQAEWMHNGGREIVEGMLVVDCPEAAR